MIVVTSEIRRAEGQACELANWRDFIQRFHRRVAQGEPVLQQINAQHGFQRIGFSTTGRGRDGSYLLPPHRSVRAELPHTAPASGM
jgi:hypothetical protein